MSGRVLVLSPDEAATLRLGGTVRVRCPRCSGDVMVWPFAGATRGMQPNNGARPRLLGALGFLDYHAPSGGPPWDQRHCEGGGMSVLGSEEQSR